MTFTNRLGQDILIRLNGEDEPKVLHASDSRVSFVCHEATGTDKLQVSLLHDLVIVLSSMLALSIILLSFAFISV